MIPETPGSSVPLMSAMMGSVPQNVTETDHLEAEAAFKIKDSDAIKERSGTDNLVNIVRERFDRSKTARLADEQRWLKCYYNYRGNYNKDFQFQASERSRVFVKITKSKVLAAYGQLIDVLLAGNKFPITVDPTSVPEGIVEAFHIDMQKLQGKSPPSPNGEDEHINPADIGEYYNRIFPNAPAKEGEGRTPAEPTFYPAYKAAKKMERKIYDQLEETGATSHLRHTAFEMALLGTGIMKGPMATTKEYPRYDEDGNYTPTKKTVPTLTSTSVWAFYPDPEGVNVTNLNWCIERHLLTKTQGRKLKNRPHFIAEVIDQVFADSPGYEKQWWENELNDSFIQDNTERFEVLEYWGMIDRKDLEDFNISIPPEENDDEFQVNIWVCNHRVLRCVFNPFRPARIPYHACPYELNPYNFFGVGVAENMEDTQTLMNGFARMAVDNAVLAGNVLLEVDETHLVPGQDLRMEPGKVIRRSGGPPGQAIFATKWQSTAQENMLMFDKFRQIADENVGIPSYSHGQTGVSGTTRTAAGMSMLMGASSLNIKTVVKNVDDYLLQPIGEALFAFNMQFDFDKEIKGDLEVKARGTASLMRKEIQSQRILQLLQITSNPALAPFMKFPYLLRNLTENLDIDPDKAVNSIEEAQLQAAIIGLMAQAQQGPPPPDPAAMGGEAAVGQDTSGGGGGNIGVGSAPQPGQQGFSGAPPGGAAPAGPPPGAMAETPDVEGGSI